MAVSAVYYYVIGLISMIMIGILILTYLAAKVFRSQELEAWFNVELTEFFASFIILFFALGFFVAADIFAGSFTSLHPGATPIEGATIFIQKIFADAISASRDMYHLQACVSILSTIHKRIGEFVLTVTYKVFPGLDAYLGIINVLTYGLTFIVSSLNAQLIFLTIIDATMSTLFLPAGILLRFFPPTREAGLFLIAASIAFQTVFPITYLINEQVLYGNYPEGIGYKGYGHCESLSINPFSQNNAYNCTPTMISHICYRSGYFFLGVLGNPAAPFFGQIPVFGTLFNLVFSEYGIALLTPAAFRPILADIAMFSLPSLFLPALSVSITFAFINAFMKFVLHKV